METLIRHLIYWETGVSDSHLSLERLFENARGKGVAYDPADLGGLTLVGITNSTYKEYCRRKGLEGTQLSSLDYSQWIEIFTDMFWSRWLADRIKDRKTARMLVDWLWMSGNYAIKIPQRELGVKVDGIVGQKTLAALNALPSGEAFRRMKNLRIAHIESICRARPANRRFRTGWLRRINSL